MQSAPNKAQGASFMHVSAGQWFSRDAAGCGGCVAGGVNDRAADPLGGGRRTIRDVA